MTYLALIVAIIWFLPLVISLILAMGSWASPRLRRWCLEHLIGSEHSARQAP